MQYIDLRSDTVTDPTPQMRQSILTSQYGDAGFDQDQTVLKLQKFATQLMGKQAACYVPTGTFGNQCSLMTAGKPGSQVLLADNSHIIAYQNGSLAKLGRLIARTLPAQNGLLTVETLKSSFRKVKDSQAPKTTILQLENPNSLGRVYPLETFHQLINTAKKQGLHVHLDGGRIFYACDYYKIKDVKELIKNVDSMMFCLSKGLCAPVGSMVVGTKQFIDRFKINRKMLGGNFRKPGILAGTGIIALDQMRHYVSKDNQIAKLLARQLNNLKWCKVLQQTDINLIFFKFTDERINPQQLRKQLLKNKIKCFMGSSSSQRFVVHHYIRQKQVQKIINVFKNYYQSIEMKQIMKRKQIKNNEQQQKKMILKKGLAMLALVFVDLVYLMKK